jgi:imidazole glycerol-phosphate synthase subunit HisH
MREHIPHVAIVDYGMGNLYNVQRACAHVGLEAKITTSAREMLEADGIILPGVGAMPEAMRELSSRGFDEALREAASRDTPLFGVCLGLQLLMSHGTEFTEHAGLGIVAGRVVRFPKDWSDGRGGVNKVPHVGWSRIRPPADRPDAWRDTVLSSTPEDTSMYFVHSYHVVPDDSALVTARAEYGGIEFTAALSSGNIFACQFHPERSGPAGLELYRLFAARIDAAAEELI